MTQPTIEQMIAFLDDTMMQVEDDTPPMRYLQAIRAALQQQAHGVADAEAALKARLLEIGGCSNHGCYIVKPVGQGTNGPCHCLDDRYKAKRVVGAYHAAISAAKDGAG